MYLPPLQPIANSEIQICGDVEIHPTASIAPGVILKAATNARIVIGADVCLGMGVILNAYNGSIEIETGVALGSGVLIIGSSKIGANACIGTASTIFNASIAAMTVINPGSLIGDPSRSWTPENNPTSEGALENESAMAAAEISPEIRDLASDVNSKKAIIEEPSLRVQEVVDESDNIVDSDPWVQEEIPIMTSQFAVEKPEQNSEMSSGVAIGKVYIDQLLVTLFPHKNSTNNNPNNKSK